MSIQSSDLRILFPFKHHLCKSFSFILCQCSDCGKGLLYHVHFLQFFLLSFLVFFVWTVCHPVSCSPAFETFPWFHQDLSFLKCQHIYIHCAGVFLLCCLVPAPVHCLVLIPLVTVWGKNSCCFSSICIELDGFF